jgi:glutathione S-transferase
VQARKLTRRRIFQALPEEVFQAFVSAEALREWWSPEGYVVVEAHADVRVGGQYRLVMRAQTGSETVYVRGSYEEITPPHKLVFTHMFENRDSGGLLARAGLAGHQTLVTVEFKAHGSTTELVLVQENIPTPDAEELVQVGWQGILDHLASYLEHIDRSDPRKA